MRKLKQVESPLSIHPFLLAIFPILFFYSNNINQVSLDVLPNPLLVSLGLTILFVAILNLFFRDIQKSALIFSFLSILFFSFGHIKTFVSGPEQIILVVWIMIFIVGAYLLIRTKKSLSSLNNFLNISSLEISAFALSIFISCFVKILSRKYRGRLVLNPPGRVTCEIIRFL